MANEIEIKARIDYGKAESFLKENAKFKKKYFKKDIYFAKEQSDNINEMLRLRKERGGYVFTAKTRKMVEKTEINDEREISVSRRASKNILSFIKEVLGYEEYVKKEKRGKAFIYKGVLVEISKVKGLGEFVELELLNSEKTQEEQIRLLKEVLSDLSLSESDIEEKPYVKMLKEIK